MTSSPIFDAIYRRLTEEFPEPPSDNAGDSFRASALRKSMRGSVDFDEFGASWYQLKGSLQLLDSPESVPGTADEKRWSAQFREMRSAKPRWVSRRMQRI